MKTSLNCRQNNSLIMKQALEKLTLENSITNVYSDHSGDIDGEFCDEQSNLTEAGMAVVATLIAEDLSNLPVKQF